MSSFLKQNSVKPRRNSFEGSNALVEQLDQRVLLSVVATVAAANIVANRSGPNQIAVIYASSEGIDPATVQPGQITINGPHGPITPSLVDVSADSGAGFSVTAVYNYTPPNGQWEMADDGAYTVDVSANAIKDNQGNALAAGTIGSFNVNIQPATILSGGVLLINGTSGADTITVARSAGNVVVTENGTPTDFDGGLVSTISVIGGTGTESVNLNCDIRSTVLGTQGDDTIVALTGAHSITGAGGDDSITGGSGNDTIRGAAGNDTLVGAGGDDILRGGAGDDILIGGAGNDTLVGGADHDSLSGGAGINVIKAIDGTSDTIDGGATSTVHADAGIDDVLNATVVVNT